MLWDLSGDVLAAPELALCGWTDVTLLPLSLLKSTSESWEKVYWKAIAHIAGSCNKRHSSAGQSRIKIPCEDNASMNCTAEVQTKMLKAKHRPSLVQDEAHVCQGATSCKHLVMQVRKIRFLCYKALAACHRHVNISSHEKNETDEERCAGTNAGLA